MKPGKLPETHLERSVLKELNMDHKVTGARPAVGMDAAPLMGTLIFAQAVVDIPVKYPARLAVIKAVNNLAAGGGALIGITLTIFMPQSANESAVRQLVAEAKNKLDEYGGAQIFGGDTRIGPGVNIPIIQVSAFGTAVSKTGQNSLYLLEPDMDIVMTKWIAMEATYLLAENCHDELHDRFSESYINRGLEFGQHLSVVPEAGLLHQLGIYTMHDVSTGGLFAALWELLTPSGLGCQIAFDQIPVKQESIEYSEFYNVNPYMLTGSGSLLAAVKDGSMVVQALFEAGIYAAVIGKTTKEKARTINTDASLVQQWQDPAKPRRRKEVNKRCLVPPKSDEIYRLVWNVKQ